MSKGWNRPFEDSIVLPDGRELLTLKNAADYIMKLPKAEQKHEKWQTAVEVLIIAAEGRGPLEHRAPPYSYTCARPRWLVDCAASSRHSFARARDVARSILDISATCSDGSGRTFGTVRRRQTHKFSQSRARPATMKKIVNTSNKTGIM